MDRPRSLTLEGTNVRLEPLASRHLEDLEAAADEDPRTFAYMPTDPPTTGWSRWLEEALRQVRAGVCVAWATVAISNNRAVGSTRFVDIAPEHDRLEIGWTWLGLSSRRTPVNTEAKFLQLRYAFDELGARRVALKTDAQNEESQRAIARLGAVREGVLRHHMRRHDGYLRDTVYFSILSEEWPTVRDQLIGKLRS
jgi:RimJ/RimL family protein N-acetyltransferase